MEESNFSQDANKGIEAALVVFTDLELVEDLDEACLWIPVNAVTFPCMDGHLAKSVVYLPVTGSARMIRASSQQLKKLWGKI